MATKKGYFVPEVEIISLCANDMIRTSGEPVDPENYGVGVAWKDVWNTQGGEA